MLGGNTVDHLLNENGLSHPSPTEQTDLASLEVGANQVEDLDSGLEDGLLRLNVLKRGRRPMNRPARL